MLDGDTRDKNTNSKWNEQKKQQHQQRPNGLYATILYFDSIRIHQPNVHITTTLKKQIEEEKNREPTHNILIEKQ